MMIIIIICNRLNLLYQLCGRTSVSFLVQPSSTSTRLMAHYLIYTTSIFWYQSINLVPNSAPKNMLKNWSILDSIVVSVSVSVVSHYSNTSLTNLFLQIKPKDSTQAGWRAWQPCSWKQEQEKIQRRCWSTSREASFSHLGQFSPRFLQWQGSSHQTNVLLGFPRQPGSHPTSC